MGDVRLVISGGTRHGNTVEFLAITTNSFGNKIRNYPPKTQKYYNNTMIPYNNMIHLVQAFKHCSINNFDVDCNASLQQTMFPSLMPIDVCYHVMIGLDENRVILIGGCDIDCCPSKKVFMGNLSKDETDMYWNELCPMIMPRQEHLGFSLKNWIYVAGGIGPDDEVLCCCERYNIEENKWESTSYQLPYPLHEATAVVVKNEDFVLITGGMKNKKQISDKLIVFTEKCGFSEIDHFSLKVRRYGHVCVIY